MGDDFLAYRVICKRAVLTIKIWSGFKVIADLITSGRFPPASSACDPESARCAKTPGAFQIRAKLTAPSSVNLILYIPLGL